MSATDVTAVTSTVVSTQTVCVEKMPHNQGLVYVWMHDDVLTEVTGKNMTGLQTYVEAYLATVHA